MIPIEEFADRAQRAFEEIPPEFREHVAGPVIVERPKRHAEVRGLLTLGECVHTPNLGGGEPLQSTVFLYYGSFARLAERDPSFDVDAEIVETVRHEVQHHIEDMVGHAGLRDLDWAEEQNQRWKEGDEFTPRFWLAGEPHGDPAEGLRAVGLDVFTEVVLRDAEWQRACDEGLVLSVGGEEVEIAPGELDPEIDEDAFEFEGLGRSLHGSGPGDLVVVVRRRSGTGGGARRA